MGVSGDLISQLVKSTNDNTETKNETTVYGTIVDYNGSKWVRIDGSDLLTPISTTTDTEPGERVTVMIKNHSAMVTGNISSPSARTDVVKEIGSKISEFEIVIADKVSASELEVERGRIDELVSDNVTIKETLTASEADISELKADNATITGKLTAVEADISSLETTKLSAEIADVKYATVESLEATNADIHNLEATYGEFQSLATNKFTAIEADIGDLETSKLSATEADLKYANIDFSNIGEAAIKAFYAKSGVIQNIVISDGQVTGTLVGVTIKGDLIEGGTVVADKLVIKGEDGLYYKLNTNGETVSSEQTEYNSLSGTIITAKSVTAEKIAVDDLVAFGATIGGFRISTNSIYSGVKESVNNGTRGIYMDNQGQIAFGDSQNFIKYYKDANEDYKLEISAKSIKFGASGSSVEDAINSIDSKLELKLDTDKLISQINASADKINITGDRLVIDSTNFQLAADGTITATNGNFGGEINAYSGTIGGWNVDDSQLYGGSDSEGIVALRAPGGHFQEIEPVIVAGCASLDNIDSARFKVFSNGSVSAIEGRIGGFSLRENYLCTDKKYYNDENFLVETAMTLTNGAEIAPPCLSFEGINDKVTTTYSLATITVSGGGTKPDGVSAFDSLDISMKSNAGTSKIQLKREEILVSSTKISLLGPVAVTGTLSSSSNITASGNISASGSLSTYGYTVPRIQHGRISQQITANTATDVVVTFPKAFPGAPDVVITPVHNSDATSINCKIKTISSAGFTAYIYGSNGGNHVFHWIAMYG